jgi:hypothetical protein
MTTEEDVMRRIIICPLKNRRTRLLQRTFELRKRRFGSSNCTDLRLIAHLQSDHASLEPLGPLAGKKGTQAVGLSKDQPLDCSD